MTESLSYKDHRIYTICQTAPEVDGRFLVAAVIRGPLTANDPDSGLFSDFEKCSSLKEANSRAIEKAKAWVDKQLSKGT
jgi:hypothetical protein